MEMHPVWSVYLKIHLGILMFMIVDVAPSIRGPLHRLEKLDSLPQGAYQLGVDTRARAGRGEEKGDEGIRMVCTHLFVMYT